MRSEEASPDVAGAGSGARAGDAIYGLLSLAGVEVALPIAALREVVPCPAEFSELPASAPGLLGAMSLRELVVPVLDLREQLGARGERAEQAVVVIIAQDERILGLLADGARGITRVSEGDLRAVHAGGGPLLFSHTFRHPEVGCVVSVLHVSALMGLPGVPTVHDAAAATGGPLQVAGHRGGPRRTFTLLRCGEHVLAIEVGYVHTTLAAALPQPSVLDSELCQGVTEYTEQQVPVVDPLVLLGLGQLPGERTGSGLVLAFPDGYVVLALTTLVDIVEIAAEDVLALPAFSVRRPELLAGIIDVEGPGQCLVLDGGALLGDPDLQGLASMNMPADADAETAPGARAAGGAGSGSAPGASSRAGAEAAAVAGSGRVYLTYSVGRDVATPLEQIAEIAALPAVRTPTDVGEVVLGVVVHRRAAVPVLCLATLLGLPAPEITSSTCLLVVPVDGDHVGFAVEALRSIDPLTWEQRSEEAADGVAAHVLPDVAQALRTARLVNVGENPRLLPDLDLRAIARAVRAQMSPAGHAPPPPSATDGVEGLAAEASRALSVAA